MFTGFYRVFIEFFIDFKAFHPDEHNFTGFYRVLLGDSGPSFV